MRERPGVGVGGHLLPSVPFRVPNAAGPLHLLAPWGRTAGGQTRLHLSPHELLGINPYWCFKFVSCCSTGLMPRVGPSTVNILIRDTNSRLQRIRRSNEPISSIALEEAWISSGSVKSSERPRRLRSRTSWASVRWPWWFGVVRHSHARTGDGDPSPRASSRRRSRSPAPRCPRKSQRNTRRSRTPSGKIGSGHAGGSASRHARGDPSP